MQHTSFEYFSTICPMSDTFSDEDPKQATHIIEVDTTSIASLIFVDKGYKVFDHENKETKSSTLK